VVDGRPLNILTNYQKCSIILRNATVCITGIKKPSANGAFEKVTVLVNRSPYLEDLSTDVFDGKATFSRRLLEITERIPARQASSF
jgi:hypothetical protein